MKKIGLTTLILYSVAIAFAVLAMCNFEWVEYNDALINCFFFLGIVLLSVVLVMTLVCKNKNLLIIPFVGLLMYGLYLSVIAEQFTSTTIFSDLLTTSYPALEFVLLIGYVVALIFALAKKQKWAVIVVIVYSSIQIFNYLVLPFALIGESETVSYTALFIAYALVYAGQISYFSKMLVNAKEEAQVEETNNQE